MAVMCAITLATKSIERIIKTSATQSSVTLCLDVTWSQAVGGRVDVAGRVEYECVGGRAGGVHVSFFKLGPSSKPQP